MENSASCSTGSVSPRNVFCSECEIHTDFEKKTVSGVGKEHVENVLEEHSQKGRDVQKRLNETTELREQQITSLRLIIADLQSKLMEVQLEGDALQDTREKGSQSQESVKIQLKNTIQELEAANRLQEEMLREADSQTEHLKKMVCSHEEVLLELRSILMDYEDCTGKKHYEHENITSLHIHSLSTAFADVLRDLGSEVSYLKERVLLVEEELESLKKDSRTQNQVLLQQHQNRKQTRNQISVRAHHISHLESTVSQLRSELREAKRTYEDKVEDLEKQLHVAHSEIAEAQTEQDQCSQESGNLNDRIHHLLMTELHKKEIQLSLEKEQNKRFWDQNADNSITVDHLRRELDNKNTQLQRMENTVKEMRTECHRQMARQMAAIKERNESFGKIFSLTVQLQSTKETLCKVKEDLTAKQTDLETAEKTVSDLTARLQEKERALEGTNKEIKKLHSQLGSRMQELQRVKNEEDCLHNVQLERETLKLLEKIKIIELFQKQIDNMTQMVGQHSRTAEAMEVEKSQLVKEINDWKLKVEDLQIAKDEKEARIHEMAASLSELELEKVKLVETCSDRLHELNDMKLEKDQLMNELQACRSELASLAEGFEDVKRNYQGKMKETENTANRLKMQLKSAQAELEQTRSALKTMEGSDGHALKVAVGMQKQITAKRGQIDALQSKIKFLEEVVTNAAKEKHYLREENLKLSQELSCIAAENAKISGELEILRSRDKHLKEKIPKMETALDKASMQFAECQCIIQCQEQAAMRFRLQHTLDVKPGILKEEPLHDLKRILQELTSSETYIPSVDLDKGDRNGGRKSPSATTRNGVDPSRLRTADLQSQDVTLTFTSLGGASIFSASPHCTTSPKKVSQVERYRERSPVHLLLTALPDGVAGGPSASPGHRPSVRKAGFPAGAATVPQLTCQPMETTENTPVRLQNKMGSLQNPVQSLQIKKQAMSSTIRTQEMKTEKAKEREKKLSN